MSFTINPIKFTEIVAYPKKYYSLEISANGLEKQHCIKAFITAYNLIKILKNVEVRQNSVVKEIISRLEKNSIAEGEIINFDEPIHIKEHISITLSQEPASNSYGKPAVALLENEFFVKGLA